MSDDGKRTVGEMARACHELLGGPRRRWKEKAVDMRRLESGLERANALRKEGWMSVADLTEAWPGCPIGDLQADRALESVFVAGWGTLFRPRDWAMFRREAQRARAIECEDLLTGKQKFPDDEP